MQALQDFKERVRQYEKVYQPVTDGTSNRDMHFIQLVNMVTGRGHMDINRISGYIPGKIVFFLMQVRRLLYSSFRLALPVILIQYPYQQMYPTLSNRDVARNAKVACVTCKSNCLNDSDVFFKKYIFWGYFDPTNIYIF